MGLLQWPRQDVARRHREIVSLVAREGLLGEHPRHRVQGLRPHRPLGLAGDAEPTQLDRGAGLAGPEVDPPVRYQVESGYPFRDPGRVVDRRGGLDDAVAQPDAPGALARGGQEHLGRRRVRVLLEEVMLDLPDVVDPRLVGQLDLLERFAEQPVLGVGAPRSGQLVLIEDAEPHVVLLDQGTAAA
jgi:hypothetical protein